MLTILGLSFLSSLICASVSVDRIAGIFPSTISKVIPRFLSGNVKNLGQLILRPFIGVRASSSVFPDTSAFCR